eukprot:TRINITY_DN317_c0_g1_i1.p1 TRINITY_DN317_c0_g1~~TRINITY_DN317_c0_g1_i1.p1  ORF type:complete len:523 (-),score=157.91 TRINITY_DN317_c0_g1_i1:8774-10342(-)
MGSDTPESPPRAPAHADAAPRAAALPLRAVSTAAAAAPDATAIRTRRVLEAAATARRDVSSFVSSLSAPKPPRAPAALKSARRRSLVPLHDEVRARVAQLERVVAERDAALLALKKQLGRALIKARHARQEREALGAKVARLVALLRKQQSALLATHTACATLVDDVHACVGVAREALSETPALHSLRSTVEHLESALEMASAKMTPPMAEFANVDVDDDDAKSVTSFASSLADDRDAQLDTLVELVQLLESRLSTCDGDGVAAAAVTRARRTIQGARQDGAPNASDSATELPDEAGVRDAKRGEVCSELADARLVEAQRQLHDMTARVNALQKIAERAVRADEALAKNVQLESQLGAAKKTIQRLLQQRCAKSSRRAASLDAPAVNWSARAPADGAPDGATASEVHNATQRRALHGASAETVRRILDWRQRASENHAPMAAQAADGVEERLMAIEGQSVVDSFGSISAQSLPVQGFLKRHDSFLSTGGVSASGEEIMLANGRNPFASSKTPKVDGLRFLLG